MPSMRTLPPVGSYRRATSEASVVLPEPVSPTSASVSRRNVQVDAGDRGPVGAGVAEADILQPDVPGDPGRVDLDRAGGFGDVDGQVEVLEDRANSASELITETPVLSRPVSGRNRPFCRVVKAIRVPMVITPAVTGRPAAR